MAKKKHRKKENEGFKCPIEVIGILLILLSVLGLLRDKAGIAGNFISNFAIFLVGVGYPILLLIILVIGIYILVKRKSPSFFTKKLLGFYFFVISVIVLAHIKYVVENNIEIASVFKATFNELLNAFENTDSLSGSGLIGALLSFIMVKLFAVEGTYVVIITLTIFGCILAFNISISNVVKKSVRFIKKLFTKKDKEYKDVKEVEEEYENDKKIIVSSIDEVTKKVEIKTEEVPIEEIENEVISNNTGKYRLPSISLLNPVPVNKDTRNSANIKNNISLLESVLKDFGVDGKVVDYHIGPSVTQYEVEIKAGTKVSKILSINREIALALAAKDVRIQAPIPGKKTIGIEIPNAVINPVYIREMLGVVPKDMASSKLLVALGKNIMGKPIFAEINKTPHLLVAGATGSGKSVCINTIIASILIRTLPNEVKLIMVDPKKVELSMYNGIPHLLRPVVTDPKKASLVLKEVVAEMESRYDKFSATGTKNIAGYNTLIQNKNSTLPIEEQKPILPYIVVIIDELADLMLVAAKEVEDSIMRITQMARAAGIHLIVATQRPSTDVITGVVKANIPSRISFAVSSSIDSRTILDMSGAEKLLGKGDMLFLPMGENIPERVQGAFISEEETKKLVDYVVAQNIKVHEYKLPTIEETKDLTTGVDTEIEKYDDPLYNEIVEFVIKTGKVSASLLQRKYRLGYNRAARIIDLLEDRGIIGAANGSKPREVLVKLKNDDKEE